MRDSAVVLLSGGLDSAFNLAKAHERFSVKLVLTFDYGQRAATREMAASAALARHYGVARKTIDLKWFADFTRTALLGGEAVPVGSAVSIDDMDRSRETARAVWVPNRNGIFLNIAAGFAEGNGAQFVIPGFNIEEAATFPDNSEAYLNSLTENWKYSTATRVEAFCFSSDMNKTQIVAEAIKLKLPLKLLWPCYLPGETWCGECESCRRFKRAVESNGLSFEDLRKT